MKTLKIYSTVALVLILTASIFMSGGCSHTTPTPQGPFSTQVKKITERPSSTSAESYLYKYDVSGKLTGIYWDSILETYYNFYGDSVYMMVPAINNNAGYIGKLDSNNRLIFMRDLYMNGSFDYRVSYDTNGYMSHTEIYVLYDTFPGPFDTILYTWADGNLINIKGATTNRTVSITYTNLREYRERGFSGYPLPSRGQNPFSLPYPPGTACGRNSKNLISTLSFGNVTYRYSYTLDVYGRVSTQTQDEDNNTTGGPSRRVYTFEYY